MDTWGVLAIFAEDSKELIGFLLAIAGALLAFFRYSSDKAWERNKFAREYAECTAADPVCRLALNMIDWNSRDVPTAVPPQLGATADRTIKWTEGSIAHALRLHAPFNEDEYFIRSAFDALLDRFDWLGYAIKRRLISKAEFPSSLSYYFERLEDRPQLGIAFARYAQRYGFGYVHRLSPRLGRLHKAGKQLAAEEHAAITRARRESESTSG